MLLEGVVTNVANFGAFVDIGVHQDGLVHVSQLADRFVKDPRDVVKAGDIVTVRVMEVDLPRKRIALTMRKAERPAPRPAQAKDTRKAQPGAGAQEPRGTRPPARAPQPERQDRAGAPSRSSCGRALDRDVGGISEAPGEIASAGTPLNAEAKFHDHAAPEMDGSESRPYRPARCVSFRHSAFLKMALIELDGVTVAFGHRPCSMPRRCGSTRGNACA